jgi:hypothetical protein
MFYPEDPILGTVLEYQNFSFSIYYEEEDLLIPGNTTRYPVVITPNQTNPTTVVRTNGDPGSISGYFYDSFDNSITYRTPQDTFVTVDKFEQISRSELSEMTSYDADTTRTINYTYTVSAMNGSTVVAINNYTITVQNDWTSGKNSLQTYVGYTR